MFYSNKEANQHGIHSYEHKLDYRNDAEYYLARKVFRNYAKYCFPLKYDKLLTRTLDWNVTILKHRNHFKHESLYLLLIRSHNCSTNGGDTNSLFKIKKSWALRRTIDIRALNYTHCNERVHYIIYLLKLDHK